MIPRSRAMAAAALDADVCLRASQPVPGGARSYAPARQGYSARPMMSFMISVVPP